MYIRNKRAFRELISIIRVIEVSPNKLKLVKEINIRILNLILNSEKAIARHKEARKSLKKKLKTDRGGKETSRYIKKKIKMVAGYITAQNDQIFIWKCFGDTLAFIYLDSFSIKHAFYNTDDYEVKYESGRLCGKIGLQNEISVLYDAIDNGVPAVLCDITNTLRYGDVCLLGGSDPISIEVKSSKNLNQRGMRQKEKLQRLHEFMETDSAEDFRGNSGPTKRVTIPTLPKYNLKELNDCITRAKTEGYATVMPEKGVTYVVIRHDGDVTAALKEIKLESPEIYYLNEFKNDYVWPPYSPFFLSIFESEDLLDFIEGRLYVVVFLEMAQICSLMQNDGWKFRYRPTDQYSIQCLHIETNAYIGISNQFVARAAFEFMSLKSIAEIHKPSIEELQEIFNFSDIQKNKRKNERRLIEIFGSDDEWTKEI